MPGTLIYPSEVLLKATEMKSPLAWMRGGFTKLVVRVLLAHLQRAQLNGVFNVDGVAPSDDSDDRVAVRVGDLDGATDDVVQSGGQNEYTLLERRDGGREHLLGVCDLVFLLGPGEVHVVGLAELVVVLDDDLADAGVGLEPVDQFGRQHDARGFDPQLFSHEEADEVYVDDRFTDLGVFHDTIPSL